MRSKSELEALIRNSASGGKETEMLQSLRKSLIMNPHEKQLDSPMESHFGGRPYVPRDFSWPLSSPRQSDGEEGYEPHQYAVGPMRFICQVNLAELPFVPVAIEDATPKIICVFASIQKLDFPYTDCEGEDWKITVVDEGEGIACEPPKLSPEFCGTLRMYSDAPVEGESILLPQFGIEFLEYWQFDPRLLYGNPGASPELDMRFESMPLHSFGSYPNFLQSPVEDIGAEFRSMSAEKMRGFMQFDSDPQLGLNWAGGGRGYVITPELDGSVDLHHSVLVTQQ